MTKDKRLEDGDFDSDRLNQIAGYFLSHKELWCGEDLSANMGHTYINSVSTGGKSSEICVLVPQRGRQVFVTLYIQTDLLRQQGLWLHDLKFELATKNKEGPIFYIHYCIKEQTVGQMTLNRV